MPLAAVDFLAVIPAVAGSGHGVGGAHRLRVDDRRRWGGLRPAAVLTCSPRRSCTRSRVPSARQAARYPYTVRHGGYSLGRYRHAHPVRTTYKIASTITAAGA